MKTKIFLFAVWVLTAIVRLIIWPVRWYTRRKKFHSTFERAKARMERVARNASGEILDLYHVQVNPQRPYFKSETEAREFRD